MEAAQGSDVGRAAGTGAEGSGALWRICRRGAGEAIDDRRAKIDGAALANWRPLHSTPHAAQSLAASRRSPQDPSSPSSPASVALPRPRSRSDPVSYVLLTSPLSLLLHPVLSPQPPPPPARTLHAPSACHGRVSSLARPNAAAEQRPDPFPAWSSASRLSEPFLPRKFSDRLLACRPRSSSFSFLLELSLSSHTASAFLPAREPPQHAQGSSLESLCPRLFPGMMLTPSPCIPNISPFFQINLPPPSPLVVQQDQASPSTALCAVFPSAQDVRALSLSLRRRSHLACCTHPPL